METEISNSHYNYGYIFSIISFFRLHFWHLLTKGLHSEFWTCLNDQIWVSPAQLSSAVITPWPVLVHLMRLSNKSMNKKNTSPTVCGGLSKVHIIWTWVALVAPSLQTLAVSACSTSNEPQHVCMCGWFRQFTKRAQGFLSLDELQGIEGVLSLPLQRDQQVKQTLSRHSLGQAGAGAGLGWQTKTSRVHPGSQIHAQTQILTLNNTCFYSMCVLQWTPAAEPRWRTAAGWRVYGGGCRTAGSRTRCPAAVKGCSHSQHIPAARKQWGYVGTWRSKISDQLGNIVWNGPSTLKHWSPSCFHSRVDVKLALWVLHQKLASCKLAKCGAICSESAKPLSQQRREG